MTEVYKGSASLQEKDFDLNAPEFSAYNDDVSKVIANRLIFEQLRHTCFSFQMCILSIKMIRLLSAILLLPYHICPVSVPVSKVISILLCNTILIMKLYQLNKTNTTLNAMLE